MRKHSIFTMATALVLALVLLLSVPASALSVEGLLASTADTVLADNSGASKKVKISGNYSYYKGKRYVCLGDSIAAGFGPYNTKNRGFARADQAYSSQLSDVLGTTLVPLARTAFRTVEVRAMLDHSYAGDGYMYHYAKGLNKKLIKKFYNLYPKEAKKADLITIQLGANDVTHMALIYAEAVLEAQVGSAEVAKLFAEVANMEDAMDGLISVLDLADTLGVLPVVAAAALAGGIKGFETFKTNWDAIMKYLYKVNPDVEIIVVGIYNAGKTIQIPEGNALPLGKAIDGLIAYINEYMRTGSSYSSKYTYVDCSKVEIYPYTLTDLLEKRTTLVHPTPAGHKYIANQIGKALSHKKKK